MPRTSWISQSILSSAAPQSNFPSKQYSQTATAAACLPPEPVVLLPSRLPHNKICSVLACAYRRTTCGKWSLRRLSKALRLPAPSQSTCPKRKQLANCSLRAVMRDAGRRCTGLPEPHGRGTEGQPGQRGPPAHRLSVGVWTRFDENGLFDELPDRSLRR